MHRSLSEVSIPCISCDILYFNPEGGNSGPFEGFLICKNVRSYCNLEVPYFSDTAVTCNCTQHIMSKT